MSNSSEASQSSISRFWVLCLTFYNIPYLVIMLSPYVLFLCRPICFNWKTKPKDEMEVIKGVMPQGFSLGSKGP